MVISRKVVENLCKKNLSWNNFFLASFVWDMSYKLVLTCKWRSTSLPWRVIFRNQRNWWRNTHTSGGNSLLHVQVHVQVRLRNLSNINVHVFKIYWPALQWSKSIQLWNKVNFDKHSVMFGKYYNRHMYRFQNLIALVVKQYFFFFWKYQNSPRVHIAAIKKLITDRIMIEK
jgi:hypothetical protein